MADNRLLGTGGMYYNNNEIGKAYLGNGLIWEKKKDFLIKASNYYRYNNVNASKTICIPLIYIHNTNNKTGSFLLKIGLINYFTYTSGGYSTTSLFRVIDNNSTQLYPIFKLEMGNGGVLCTTYANYSSLNNNSANVGNYREYEITLTSIKDVTNNKTVNISNTAKYIPKILRLWPALGGSYLGYCNCAYHYIQVYMDNVLIHDYHTGKVGNYYAFIDNVNSSNNIVLNETNTNNNVSLFSEVALP